MEQTTSSLQPDLDFWTLSLVDWGNEAEFLSLDFDCLFRSNENIHIPAVGQSQLLIIAGIVMGNTTALFSHSVPKQPSRETRFDEPVGLVLPESVQTPAWVLQSSWQLHKSGVSWIIVAQVQLPQMRRVGVQCWGYWGKAFLCDQAARQPEEQSEGPQWQKPSKNDLQH